MVCIFVNCCLYCYLKEHEAKWNYKNQGTREIDLLPEIFPHTAQHLATSRLTSAAVFDFTRSQNSEENKKSNWPENSLRTRSGKCTLGMSYFSSSSISHRDDLSLEPALMSVRTWQADRFHGEQNKTSKKHREEPGQLQKCLQHNQSAPRCSPWLSSAQCTDGKHDQCIISRYASRNAQVSS